MAFLNPIEVLDKINIRENFITADFGSGSGGWVIPLAQKTKQGIVYAIDALGTPLSILKQKAKDEGLRNVRIIQADIEKGSQLHDGSCDLVLMTNLLFAVEDKEAVLKEGVRILKEGGHLLVVDWEAEAPMQIDNPVSSLDVSGIATELNLQLVKELPAGIYHWGLVFRK